VHLVLIADEDEFDQGPSDMARILVIDDDQGVRATLKVLLERIGHQVLTAEDGRRGLHSIISEQFDLAIIDIFMPEMDGFETIRIVRKSNPSIPIVVMSGASVAAASRPDFLSMATKLGAVRSLQKPFSPSAVHDVVEASLRSASGVSGNETR
jgi:CheY-like chemotaxis protein